MAISKTFVGPRLRQLRREQQHTQAQMARVLDVSAAYIGLLESNQRSLSVPMLMALSDAYGIDWRDLVQDDSANLLADLRHAVQDPVMGGDPPDLQELRGALDHAPKLVAQFLRLHQSHRSALEKMMRMGEGRVSGQALETSPETVIHDFFRNNRNCFPKLESAAERIRAEDPSDPHDAYSVLKGRLKRRHDIDVETASIESIDQALRVYDREAGIIRLSEALDHRNRVFQLAHVLCLVELQPVLDQITEGTDLSESGLARCHVELANYFAAAYLMPYAPFHEMAEATQYDLDKLAAAFAVSFEQVGHRLTTLQREGLQGVPFFFLRVDKAGNVTKRFNATSFNLAEYGGACPVWNIHTSFRTPGVIVPQFVETPDGQRFFTISRTTERPVFSRETQDRRLALALGCELKHADRLAYAAAYNMEDPALFSPIGITCHLCPRQACSQRAHQPLFLDLPIDTDRRGNTRYES